MSKNMFLRPNGKRFLGIAFAALLNAFSLYPAHAADPTPSWAILTPDQGQPPEDLAEKRHVPGSAKTYTVKEINDLSNPPDWLPGGHSAAPTVVSHGGGPNVFGCASCHLYSGEGHPESAELVGQPVDYLKRQMADFKSGTRLDPVCMSNIGKSISEGDMVAAIQWFSSQRDQTWFRVVETSQVPKSVVDVHLMRIKLPRSETEPLGDRIVELPEDTDRAMNRDPRSGFVSYVPVGSIAKGKMLAESGAEGRSIPCATCHGDNLKGNADFPRIAGLSALYVARQLAGFRGTTRSGPSAEAMKPVTANLTDADILALSAYLVSLKP